MAQRSVITNEDEEDFDFDPDSVDVYEDEDEEEEFDEDEDGETEDEPDQPSSQDNWEQRFKGLQSTVQRSQEQLNLARQEAFMARAESERVRIHSQGLEPVEADRQFKLWLITQANEFQAQQNATDREALEHVGRNAYLQQLVNEFSINTKSKTFERLARIKDPEDMRAFAEEVATREASTSKRVKKVTRKAKGADKFDSGGGRVGSPPKKKAKSLDDAASVFSKFKVEF